MVHIPKNAESGQSLAELLIGIGLAALLLVGAASIISPSLQANSQVQVIQSRTSLANELSQNVKNWAAGNWNGVLQLTTGTARYYLNTSSSPFTTVSTTATSGEVVTVGQYPYIRYFYLASVYRDANGNVTSTAGAGTYDPSTMFVTVIVSPSTTFHPASIPNPSYYTLNAPAGTTTLNFYLARNVANAISQSSWAGGSGQTTPITRIGTTYATSSNVSVAATGSIQITSYPGGSCTQ